MRVLVYGVIRVRLIQSSAAEVEGGMLAITGAILINAACILAASTKDSADIYLGQRLLAMLGAALIAVDLYSRLAGHIRRAKAEAAGQAKADAAPGTSPGGDEGRG